ncbi:DNA cytosine methyltransferase [Flavobacterium sp.]|uniref:DNA cytosine methyltransferase n=1 Tax=Flavobacterium sp. TaxID=239 RepID=UPI0025B921A4|nr:DNA cytosine methyltransferase [Flavobacterium sp.]
MEKKLTAIDLFSGCGGFSYGFQQAGFDVILGVDNTKIALETFKANHKGSQTLNLDLHKDSSINEIVEATNKTDVDVIIAGPPCQGFSLTGTRNENDSRNTLFQAVFKLAKELNPKALIIENVPGLLRLYDGKAKNEILRLCEEYGYTCNPKLLFAPDYGVPQIRKRVFFVALKKELGVFEFPESTHSESTYVGCKDAIGDLPDLIHDLGEEKMKYDKKPTSNYQKEMRSGTNFISNHIGTKHTDHVINVISMVPEGGNHKDLPEGVGDSRKFNEAWTRYHSEKPSKTIDTGHRNHFHYKWNRVPSVRENARLQSFPDDFIFLGNKTEQYRQVGNAVPPLLGKVLANQLKQYLLNED